MRRLLGLLFLLISFVWHSAVVAGGAVAAVSGEDAEHAALHWQEEAHHHHEDGSYHPDDSGDSLAHVQLDGMLQTAALICGETGTFAQADAVAPSAFCLVVLPLPPPDRLRRPPRS